MATLKQFSRAAVTVIAIVLLGCSSAPAQTTGAGMPTTVPATPPGSPTPTISATPITQTAPTPTASPTPALTSQFDGIWASSVVTRESFADALARNGLDVGKVDEVAGNDRVQNWMFGIEIGSGNWVETEVDNGVPVGNGWEGTFVMSDADTVVADDGNCPVTYGLSKDADALTVDVVSDHCSDPLDLLIQTAIYESSAFHLVQTADWTPPSPDPTPVASPFPATPPSTSHDRLVAQPLGEMDGALLGYYEYLPPSYSEDRSASPLLVFLHGSGESGAGDKFSLAKLTGTAIPNLISANKWPDDRPFIVLAPQHEEDPPSFCFELEEIHDFLSFALENYNVDPSRVYLTGLSCGAIGLWNYLGEHTNEVAAAAVPIAGYGLPAVDRAGCQLAALPIWAFHGAQDPNVAIEGDVYPLTFLNSCTDPSPVDARLTVYKLGGHNVWDETYGLGAGYDIYTWLLSHSK